MSEPRNLDFLLGQLSGQVSSLSQAFTVMSQSFAQLEERLRKTETNTTKLMVQMGAISIAAGGLGSLLIGYISKFFK